MWCVCVCVDNININVFLFASDVHEINCCFVYVFGIDWIRIQRSDIH